MNYIHCVIPLCYAWKYGNEKENLGSLSSRNLIQESVIAQLLGQKYSGFSAWWGEPVPATDAAYRLFLSRYIDRRPVAETRIEIVDNIITYRTDKDGATHEFSPLEFLARITAHIPNKWDQTTRYYGYYSFRTRGRRAEVSAAEGSSEVDLFEPIPRRAASKRWAALIKKVFELDPLLCPKCGGTLRIQAFITSPAKTRRLLTSLGIPPFETPQPIRASPKPFVPETDHEMAGQYFDA